MNWYIKVLKNYATFSGRARRKEYWMFALIQGTVWAILYVLMLTSDSSLIAGIFIVFVLATLVPSLAVVVRRLHDIERSGWFYFISFIPVVGPIILLVWSCKAGTTGANRYGADPKAEQPAGIIQ
ncbi:DUF805 domain-containing protein [Hafnia alvei]|uniref:DUF805 domain-containing protein n=1 Tax=Hafnia TaxID=568 RepID=UPI0006211137|nr:MULTISPECIES: DUF805 domain-containing protein [Hafnia]AWV43641.1 DUF805 domain-containing protein [Hafnia alvei]KKI43809.1 membrane protein [Hafnia alvei]MEB7889221.1 DUF805 domain-containing protein [Hafnia alvei]